MLLIVIFFRRYEGEWFANKKYGYGVTTFRDGTKEEGKYKNNVLITSQKKKHLFLIRSAKFRERIDAAVDSAQRASKYALQKADIAISRTATARGKAEAADVAADHARVDSEVAIQTAREFAPDFKPSLLERFERIRVRERFRTTVNDDTAAIVKSKLEGQMGNNISSPNKQLQSQSSPQQQQQQAMAASRRQSVKQQPSLDYASQNSMIYANKNPIDYNNSLGHNQQFSQPQPPGSSAFSTPQKQQQQFNSIQDNYNNQTTSNISIQQSQHNQLYQNNNIINNSNINTNSSGINTSSHYSSMVNQSQENMNNSYSTYNQHQSDHQIASSSYDQQPPHTNVRRSSRQVSESGRPMLGSIHQTSIDHFDHYKRPPSRDSSVDRYTRAASRLGASRQPSVDRQTLNPATNLTPEITLDRNIRGASQMRGSTPAPPSNGSVLTGIGATASNNPSRRGSRSGTPVFQPQQTPTLQQIQAHYSSPNQPFEDVILRQRTLGQDIVPSPGQPKRTESLFIPPKPIGGGGGGGSGMASGASKGAIKVSL